MNSPFILVIFGATGDLTRRKLLPSLLHLYKEKKLPEKFFVIGFARRFLTDQEFRQMLFEELEYDSIAQKNDILDGDWKDFSKHLYYQEGIFGEDEGYKKLSSRLEDFDKEMGACISRFFYLATPPTNYSEILEQIYKTGLSEGCGKHADNKLTRIIIEKPFGKDMENAKALDKRLAEIFEEKQIFRVDHYLGKETVQNMIAFRFANGIFEPIWNKNYIDHVQITFAEKKGVGERKRGRFFDGVGMLRDIAQSHLMQLIATTTMEQPMHFSKEDVREVRARAIKAIRCIEPDEVSKYVIRGRYSGYQAEKDVKPDSQTETFVAMKLFVDTDKFMDVPFYIRAGNKMPEDVVEISLVFKQTCHILFKEFGCPEVGNVITIRIQPDEGIKLRMIAKKPGSKLDLGTVKMKFSYKEEFKESGLEAYEKLLLDIFAGDQMLFNRSDELESSWGFITKIIKGWSREARSGFAREKSKSELLSYEPNTWGPPAANDLIVRDGRKWL